MFKISLGLLIYKHSNITYVPERKYYKLLNKLSKYPSKLIRQLPIELFNYSDVNGNTLLHILCFSPNKNNLDNFIKIIVPHSLDSINTINKSGETPLSLVCTELFPSLCAIQILLDSGANPNIMIDHRPLLLHIIKSRIFSLKNYDISTFEESISLMIRRGANLDLRDNDGNSVLIYVSELYFGGLAPLTLIKALIRLGSNIDAQNNKGQTIRTILPNLALGQLGLHSTDFPISKTSLITHSPGHHLKKIYLGGAKVEQECCICIDKLKRVVSFEPCGHANVCIDCYDRLDTDRKGIKKCCNCRTEITNCKLIIFD